MDKELENLLKKAIEQTIKINALEHELIKNDEKINLSNYYDTSDWQKYIFHYAISLYKGLDSVSQPIQLYTPDLNSFIRSKCKHGNGVVTLLFEDFVDYVECRRSFYESRFWKGIKDILKKETEIL